VNRAGLALLALGSAIALAAALAGCGGSDTTGSGTTAAATTSASSTTSAPSGTLEALWRQPGEDVAIVPGTNDYGPGQNRVSFLVVDKQSKLIEEPTAHVWVARGLQQKPYAETTATLEPIGVPGGVKADAQNIYVTHLDLPKAGKYWILAEPIGGKKIQALGNAVVLKHSAAPEIGEKAIPSKNPVLVPGVDPKTVTTAEPPDRELLRTTVAAAMAAHHPFVATFATPLYCQSRTCGPVVQVVQSVANDWQKKGVDFIHIEIYKDNDPAKGTNKWVDEWKLQSEPFTFVVDKNGVIRSRFEGAFSAAELQQAVSKIVS
jgi:hypothetical protein